MSFCTQCGHELGVGRFCTNCGHPVTEMTAAEQTAVRPSVPEPEPPPSDARFRLFADEVDPVAPPVTAEQPTLAPPSTPHGHRPHHARRRTPVLLWVLGAAIVAVLAVIVGALVLSGDDQPSATPRSPATTSDSSSPEPSSAPPTGGLPTGDPSDLARYLEIQAPPAAAPNEDVNGNLVRYLPGNMIDGVPETCWRTPGSAAGQRLIFTLPERAVISQVGMINGYAKTATDSAGTYDWYRGNRRILLAEWTFDDGTTVRQRLTQSTDMQAVPVDDVTTRTISLRLLEVSPPGRGRSSRDYTAISDVSVTGVKAK